MSSNEGANEGSAGLVAGPSSVSPVSGIITPSTGEGLKARTVTRLSNRSAAPSWEKRVDFTCKYPRCGLNDSGGPTVIEGCADARNIYAHVQTVHLQGPRKALRDAHKAAADRNNTTVKDLMDCGQLAPMPSTFSCYLCYFENRGSTKMAAHIVSKHWGIHFTCACGTSFVREDEINRHRKNTGCTRCRSCGESQCICEVESPGEDLVEEAAEEASMSAQAGSVRRQTRLVKARQRKRKMRGRWGSEEGDGSRTGEGRS